MEIKHDDLDKSRSFFQQLRERHPIRLNDIVEGKRVVATYYKSNAKEKSVAYVKLEDGSERLA